MSWKSVSVVSSSARSQHEKCQSASSFPFVSDEEREINKILIGTKLRSEVEERSSELCVRINTNEEASLVEE